MIRGRNIAGITCNWPINILKQQIQKVILQYFNEIDPMKPNKNFLIHWNSSNKTQINILQTIRETAKIY